MTIAVWMTMLLAGAGLAQNSSPADPWRDWRFLLGNWESTGSSGEPGKAGMGSFSFALELQGRVLVRRSFAEYPAERGGPPRHEDLLILHAGEGGGVDGVYFDSEGHVIRYHEAAAAAPGEVTLVSEPGTATPRFRLRYRNTGADSTTGQFEIAPPGQDRFSTYLVWTARRKR
jgi:hypothetical protein